MSSDRPPASCRFVLALAVAGVVVATPAPHAQTPNAFESGLAKLRARNWAGCIADFDRVIAARAADVAAVTNRANCRLQTDDAAGALADANRAVQLDPSRAGGWAIRASARIALNDLEGAATDAAKALSIEPNNHQALNSRGRVKLAREDFKGALQDFIQASTLDPSEEAYYSNRGLARERLNDWDGARADYDRAVALGPDSDTAYGSRARVRSRRGDLNGALADATRAVTLRPAASNYNHRGVTRSDLDDFAGALADFKLAKELDPKNILYARNYARTRRLSGDLAGALADFTRLIETDPRDAAAYAQRGLVHRDRRDFAAAETDARKAIATDPRNDLGHRTLAYFLYDTQRWTESLAVFRKVAEVTPGDQDYVQLRIWMIRARAGERAAATADLERFMNGRSTDSAAVFEVAMASFLTGRTTEAALMTTARARPRPTVEEARASFYVGTLHALNGNGNAAATAFKRATLLPNRSYEYWSAAAELAVPAPAPDPQASRLAASIAALTGQTVGTVGPGSGGLVTMAFAPRVGASLSLLVARQQGTEVTLEGRAATLGEISDFLQRVEAAKVFVGPANLVDTEVEPSGLVRFSIRVRVPPAR